MIDGEVWVADVAKSGAIMARFLQVSDYFTSSRSDSEIIQSTFNNPPSDDYYLDFYLPESGDVTISPPDEAALDKVTGISKDDFGNTQYVSFSLNRAVLNTKAVQQIRQLSRDYIDGKVASFLIVAFHENDTNSKKLSVNRANAVADLLQTFGVPGEVLSTSSNTAPDKANLGFVSISLKSPN